MFECKRIRAHGDGDGEDRKHIYMKKGIDYYPKDYKPLHSHKTLPPPPTLVRASDIYLSECVCVSGGEREGDRRMISRKQGGEVNPMKWGDHVTATEARQEDKERKQERKQEKTICKGEEG